MRYLFRFIVIVSATMHLQSCASTKDSVLLGLGIGSLVGAGVAAAMSVPNKNHAKSIGLGIGVGAALGGAAGYYDSKTKPKEKNQNFSEKGKIGREHEDLPSVTKPIVKKMWIPDRIEDNQFIKGHYVYVIERPSVWSTDSREEDAEQGKENRQTNSKPGLRSKVKPMAGSN